MSIETLNDAFIEELKDIYSSETQILKALPKMAKKAAYPKLKGGFELHLTQTEVHVERLESIGKMLGVKLTGKTCKATKGLVEEGAEVIEEESKNDAAIDSMLIGAARRVEHYEIAAYTSAIAMAEALNLPKVVKLLAMTLSEEIKTDSLLNVLAIQEVLPLAEKLENKGKKTK